MGAGAQKELVAPPERLQGARREPCISLQPARADASSEGDGSLKVLPGTAKGGLGDPAQSPEDSGGHFGTPGALPGCTFGSSDRDFRSAGRLGKLKFGLQTPHIAR